MKFGIVLCLLVMLACREATCDGGRAYVQGNCSLEDLPDSDRNFCGGLTCTKDEAGGVSVYAKDFCAYPACLGTRTEKPGDPTKVYPDCCPVVTCDNSLDNSTDDTY